MKHFFVVLAVVLLWNLPSLKAQDCKSFFKNSPFLTFNAKEKSIALNDFMDTWADKTAEDIHHKGNELLTQTGIDFAKDWGLLDARTKVAVEKIKTSEDKGLYLFDLVLILDYLEKPKNFLSDNFVSIGTIEFADQPAAFYFADTFMEMLKKLKPKKSTVEYRNGNPVNHINPLAKSWNTVQSKAADALKKINSPRSLDEFLNALLDLRLLKNYIASHKDNLEQVEN